MSRYTVWEDAGADAAVQAVLDDIQASVKAIVGDQLDALVLVGGYGRSEGGVYRTGAGFQLVNDLDLLLFTKLPISVAKARYGVALDDCCEQLVQRGCGLKAIDLHLRSRTDLRWLVPNTVGHYEIAAGHQVVAGNPDISQCLRGPDPRSLPAWEGTNYFRNRGSGLLIAALHMLDGLGEESIRRNFDIELQKACQAMGDALLILCRVYHFSYRERRSRFRQLGGSPAGIPPDLLRRVRPWYEWGVSRKLRPSFEDCGTEELSRRWFEIRDTFGTFFLWYESARLRRKFLDWEDYARHVRAVGAAEPFMLRLRSLAHRVRRLSSRNGELTPIAGCRQMLAVMPLLLFSLQAELHVRESEMRTAATWMALPFAGTDAARWRELAAVYLARFYSSAFVTTVCSLKHAATAAS
ncbi:MAG: hypothetical protein ABSD88_08140 [Candidatus Korobacteraceae bacterium]